MLPCTVRMHAPELMPSLSGFSAFLSPRARQVGRVWANANGPKVRPPFLDRFNEQLVPANVRRCRWLVAMPGSSVLLLHHLLGVDNLAGMGVSAAAPRLHRAVPSNSLEAPLGTVLSTTASLRSPAAWQMSEPPWLTLQAEPGVLNETVLQVQPRLGRAARSAGGALLCTAPRQ